MSPIDVRKLEELAGVSPSPSGIDVRKLASLAGSSGASPSPVARALAGVVKLVKSAANTAALAGMTAGEALSPPVLVQRNPPVETPQVEPDPLGDWFAKEHARTGANLAASRADVEATAGHIARFSNQLAAERKALDISDPGAVKQFNSRVEQFNAEAHAHQAKAVQHNDTLTEFQSREKEIAADSKKPQPVSSVPTPATDMVFADMQPEVAKPPKNWAQGIRTQNARDIANSRQEKLSNIIPSLRAGMENEAAWKRSKDAQEAIFAALPQDGPWSKELQGDDLLNAGSYDEALDRLTEQSKWDVGMARGASNALTLGIYRPWETYPASPVAEKLVYWTLFLPSLALGEGAIKLGGTALRIPKVAAALKAIPGAEEAVNLIAKFRASGIGKTAQALKMAETQGSLPVRLGARTAMGAGQGILWNMGIGTVDELVHQDQDLKTFLKSQAASAPAAALFGATLRHVFAAPAEAKNWQSSQDAFWQRMQVTGRELGDLFEASPGGRERMTEYVGAMKETLKTGVDPFGAKISRQQRKGLEYLIPRWEERLSRMGTTPADAEVVPQSALPGGTDAVPAAEVVQTPAETPQQAATPTEQPAVQADGVNLPRKPDPATKAYDFVTTYPTVTPEAISGGVDQQYAVDDLDPADMPAFHQEAIRQLVQIESTPLDDIHARRIDPTTGKPLKILTPADEAKYEQSFARWKESRDQEGQAIHDAYRDLFGEDAHDQLVRHVGNLLEVQAAEEAAQLPTEPVPAPAVIPAAEPTALKPGDIVDTGQVQARIVSEDTMGTGKNMIQGYTAEILTGRLKGNTIFVSKEEGAVKVEPTPDTEAVPSAEVAAVDAQQGTGRELPTETTPSTPKAVETANTGESNLTPADETAISEAVDAMLQLSHDDFEDSIKTSPADEQKGYRKDRIEGAEKYIREMAEAIRAKNLNRFWDNGGLDTRNKASRKLFTRLTGIELGKTDKEALAGVRQYVGPDTFDKWESDLRSKRDAERASSDAKWEKDARDYSLGNEKVRYKDLVTGETKIGSNKEFIDHIIEGGYTNLIEGKQGAIPVLKLANPEGTEHWVFRGKHEKDYIRERLTEAKAVQPSPAEPTAPKPTVETTTPATKPVPAKVAKKVTQDDLDKLQEKVDDLENKARYGKNDTETRAAQVAHQKALIEYGETYIEATKTMPELLHDLTDVKIATAKAWAELQQLDPHTFKSDHPEYAGTNGLILDDIAGMWTKYRGHDDLAPIIQDAENQHGLIDSALYEDLITANQAEDLRGRLDRMAEYFKTSIAGQKVLPLTDETAPAVRPGKEKVASDENSGIIESAEVSHGDDETQPIRNDLQGSPEREPASDVPAVEPGEEAGGLLRPDAGVDVEGRLPTGRHGDGDTGRTGDGVPKIPDDTERGGTAGVRSDPGSDLDLPEHHAPGHVKENFRIKTVGQLHIGGDKTKLENLVESLRVLKELEAAGKKARPSEQAILARFPGWGWTGNLLHPDKAKLSYWDAKRKEYDSIVSQLTPEELNAARRAALNSHFTAPEVILSMWKAIGELGFAGGRILEPSAGTGLFFGFMPDDIIAGSYLRGIEMESITGRILTQLYQGAKIDIKPFQDVRLPDNSFDLVISNVPFGNISIHDPQLAKTTGLPRINDRIHNYFFAKALTKVRPGGIVAFITSHGTLDAQDLAARQTREYLSENANLLGAIRLPNTAFKKNAGTDVTTDIIFLQKRMPGNIKYGEAFQDLGAVPGLSAVDKAGKETQAVINEYFLAHPEMVLGEHSLEGKMRHGGGTEYTLKPRTGDLANQLALAISKLPKGIYDPVSYSTPIEEAEKPTDSIKVRRSGALAKGKDGKFYVMGADGPAAMTIAPADEKVLSSFIPVRDAVLALIEQQKAGVSGDELKPGQAALKKAYDAYVKAHGLLNSKGKSAWDSDPDASLILSLEHMENGKLARLADIFDRQVITPQLEVKDVKTPQDSFMAALSTIGRLDLDWMAEKSGIPKDQIIGDLSTDGLIYEDPQSGWLMKDEYGSGNVRVKLARAKIALNAADVEGADPASIDRWKANVAYLETVQPAPLETSEITANMGAIWIPTEYYKEFLSHLFNMGIDNPVVYMEILGKWKVKNFDSNITAASSAWGTDNRSTSELLESILNATEIKITYTTSERKIVVDEEATQAARDKQSQIKTEWEKWLKDDPDRAVAITDLYNDRVNVYTPRTFDGSHLTFPGMSLTWTMRARALDAVWRMIQSDSSLLGWEAGTGKTSVFIPAVMEMRRLGIRKKPMLVVENSTVGQIANAFRRIYPGARILVGDKVRGEDRRIFMSKIATGDWDAVIVGHDAFKLLSMHPDSIRAFYNKAADDLRDFLYTADEGDKKTVKDVEAAILRMEKALAARLEKLESVKDGATWWEDLGVDHIVVDESQKHKNLMRSSARQGMSSDGSGLAFDLMMKIQYLRDLGGGVTFSTGTPITNSIAEMHTLMRYLAPEILEEQGLTQFDTWLNAFSELHQKPGRDYKGGFKMLPYLKFRNVPDMLTQYRTFADIVLASDIPEIKRPELVDREGIVTNEPIIMLTYPNDAQKRIFRWLGERVNNLPDGWKREPGDDNPLAISTDGRKASLDSRMVHGKLLDAPDSKINQVTKSILWEYHNPENAGGRRTQVVFMDQGVPGSEGFNLYRDIKGKLVAGGIPAEEVAFMQDAGSGDKAMERKLEIQRKVSAGEIRVIIGSRALMGIGVNIQERLIAAHQVDPAWRPDWLEQADKRIIRDGNLFQEKGVRLYYYVTENTFDAYMWTTLRKKGEMLNQVTRGTLEDRSIDDVFDVNETFSKSQIEAMAQGNPALIEYVQAQEELKGLDLSHRAFLDRRTQLTREIQWKAAAIEKGGKRQDEMKFHVDHQAAHPFVEAKAFKITLNGHEFDKKGKAGEYLVQVGSEMGRYVPAQIVGEYRGYIMEVRHATLDGAGGDSYVGPGALVTLTLPDNAQSGKPIEAVLSPSKDNPWLAIDNALESRGSKKSFDDHAQQIQATSDEIPVLEKERDREWERQGEYDEIDSRVKVLEAEVGNLVVAGKDMVWGEESASSQGAGREAVIQPTSASPEPTGGTSSAASGGGYAEPRVDIKTTNAAIEMPELVELAKEINGGAAPQIVRQLRAMHGKALGVFQHGPAGAKIKIRADIFLGDEIEAVVLKRGRSILAEPGETQSGQATVKENSDALRTKTAEKLGVAEDQIVVRVERGKTMGTDVYRAYKINPSLALRVLAHEFGHLADYFPTATLKRGNILGHVATLNEWLNTSIGETPKTPNEFLTTKERGRLRRAADKEAGGDPDGRAGIYRKLVAAELEKRGLVSRDEITDELKRLTHEWKPFVAVKGDPYTEYRYKPAELYADLVSVWFNDAELARGLAPKTSKMLMEYMERKPEFKEAYQAIQDRYTDRAEVVRHRLESIYEMVSGGNRARLEAANRERPVVGIRDWLVNALIDKRWAAIKGIRGREKQGGQIAADALRSKFELDEFNNVASEVNEFVYNIDQQLKVMKEQVITPVDLDAYVLQKRIQSERKDMPNPRGFTKDAMDETLPDQKMMLGEEKFNAIVDAVQTSRARLESDVFPQVRKSGIYPSELMDHIEANTDYGKFAVVKYMEETFGGEVTAVVHHQYGTFEDVAGPWSETQLQAISMLAAAKRNLTKQALIQDLSNAGEIQPADMVWSKDAGGRIPKEPKDPELGLLTVMVDGKPEHWYVDREIAKMWKYDPHKALQVSPLWAKVMGVSRDVFVSKNLGWMLFNIPRDMWGTVKNLDQIGGAGDVLKLANAYRAAFVEAYREIFKGKRSADISQGFKEYALPAHRMYSSKDISTDSQLEKRTNEVMRHIVGDVDQRALVVKAWLRVMDWLDKVGRLSELPGKLAPYKYLKQYHPEVGVQLRSHIVRSRAGTPDTTRQGAWNSVTNNIFMFSSVGMQGLRGGADSFVANPARYAWKVALMNVLPKLIIAGLGIFWADTKWGKAVNKADPYDKRMYNIVPLGLINNGQDAVYLRFPQDYEGQVIGAGVWDAIHAMPAEIIRDIWNANPYQVHPYIDTAYKAFQLFALGANPVDEYRQRNIISDQAMTAGGWDKAKEFGAYAWNSMGGSTLYTMKTGAQIHTDEIALQKILRLPGMNALGRFIRISHNGETSEIYNVLDRVRKTEAQTQIERKTETINAINDGMDVEQTYNHLVEKGLTDPEDTSLKEFERSYNRYAIKQSGDPWEVAIKRAMSTRERKALFDAMDPETRVPFDDAYDTETGKKKPE